MQPQSEATVRQRTTLSSLILLSALFAGTTLCGCAGMAGPRVDTPLDAARLEATPAFQDASRAWPIAFLAAPDTQGRFELTVDGQSHVLLVSDWVHQLAATLNRTLETRALYDRRAAVVTRKALQREVIDGRVHTGITDRSRHDREVRLSAAHIVWLSVDRIENVADGGKMALRITLRALGQGVDRRYRVITTGAHFDRAAFQQLGETMLGDGGFWASIAGSGMNRLREESETSRKTAADAVPTPGAGTTTVELGLR